MPTRGLGEPALEDEEEDGDITISTFYLHEYF